MLLKDDLRQFLAAQYATDNITSGEMESIIQQLDSLPALDLYVETLAAEPAAPRDCLCVLDEVYKEIFE